MNKEQAIEEINKAFEPSFANYIITALTDGATILYKVSEQEPCKDWHDVPSSEMTIEQARQAVRDLRKKLAEYLEQETCEDAVSREAVQKVAVDVIAKYIPILIGRFEKIPLELVRAIKDLPPVKPSVCIATVKFSKEDMQELVDKKIKEITAESNKRQWISVGERLPEVTDFYLIQYSRKICRDEMAVAFYSVEEKESDPNYEWEFKPHCGEYTEVIAWMPLPDDYKEEKESE